MFAVLYLPEFPLQAVLRTDPAAMGRAAALFAAQTKKSTVLVANAAARAAGVEAGMTAPQAVARCPTLLIRTPQAAAEADARAALLAAAFSMAPTIENTTPGVCTIDLKGTDPTRNEAAAAAAIGELATLGLTATAGIGATPLLALYAARTVASALSATAPESHAQTWLPLEAGTSHPDLTVAETAAGADAPALPRSTNPLDGRAVSAVPRPPPTQAGRAARASFSSPVLSVTDAASFLGPLPLAAADPPPETARVLAGWGIRSLGELTALSRDDIGRRLGPAGLELWDRAQGGAPRPLHPLAPAQTFAAAIDFEEEIETLEPLLFILRRFLERLTLELRTSGYVAAALELTLCQSDDTLHERSFRLPDPNADVEILFRVLHTHLEAVRTEATIVGLRLRAVPARPLVRQQGLFDTGLRDPHGFAETLARVGAIVGAERVGTPQREDSHRPDAVKLAPPPAIIPAAPEPPVHPPLAPPLRRFRPPLRAQLELTDGRPTYLWTDAFNGPIEAVRGPWLSSGDWWQANRTWRRTEYDVALQPAGLYRLVLADGVWYVEGEYD